MQSDIEGTRDQHDLLSQELAWYKLRENHEYVGPYIGGEMQEYYTSGDFTESTLLWARKQVIGWHFLTFKNYIRVEEKDKIMV